MQVLEGGRSRGLGRERDKDRVRESQMERDAER